MQEKRTKYIAVRLTNSEYQQLLDRKTKLRLAEWLRELALGQHKIIKQKADPNLLISLARIGSNMNQIARTCNLGRIDKIKSVQILLELEQINLKLRELINDS